MKSAYDKSCADLFLELGGILRSITFLLIAALCFATVSSADEIHLATTCDVNVDFSKCSFLQGSPFLDVHFGQFEFKVQDLPTGSVIDMPDETSFQVFFPNGGGQVLLLDSSSNVVAKGVFGPGALMTDQTGIETFQGSIFFPYINADSLGIGTGIIQGGGSIAYSSDAFLLGATNFYDLIIDGGPPAVPTPESGTLLLTLVGVGVFGLVKLLR